MHTPFIREQLVGDELHLYLASGNFLSEMGCEIGSEEDQQQCLERKVLQHVQAKHPDQRISKVKLFLGSMLVATLSVASMPSTGEQGGIAQAATPTVGLVANGQVLTDQSQPFTKNGQFMVPTMLLARTLGAKASYDSATKRITITDGTDRMALQIGNTTAWLNGKSVDLGTAPVLVGDTSYVPVRVVSESLGWRVVWDSTKQTILVSNQQIAVYQVKSGDTLWKIARSFSTDPASVQKMNGLASQNDVYPGSYLVVPRNATLYVAKGDDTLWNIARRFNTSVDAVKDASGLTADQIRGGMFLLIPEATPTTPMAPVPVPAGASQYTVAAGDTLWKVATKFGVSVEAIRDTNKLTTDVLRVGQILVIPKATPAPAPTGGAAGEYIVQAGDTLWGLAAKYNTTPEAIKKASGLTTNDLRLNQRIRIPGYTAAPPPPAESYLKNESPRLVSQLAKDQFIFPFRDERSYDPFRDTWGDSRGYNPGSTATRAHEGVDIFSSKGTPLVACGDGTIIRYGWNELGGWRMTIRLDGTDYSAYYAHMSSYAPGLTKGSHVKKGQVIGYVGATGYGPTGTSGKFVPHLHFGLYDNANDFKAVNPYFILKYWEARQ